jgi:limonene-1,2-epoxide hydrolase
MLAILLGLLALTACGEKKAASAPEVVRAWSAALDRNDNEHAARLFADGAQVIQNGETILATHADALRWNAALPCGGRISHLEVRGKDQVLAIFQLEERPQHRCDANGGQAATIFQVENGRIVLWHQTPVPDRYAPGGQLVYLVTGEFREFSDASHPA